MNRRDTLAAGLLSVCLMVLLVPFARLDVDMHHDGIMLKPALDVLTGQTLFRDTFMQYGALTCYLQAFALWIQPSLLSIRLMIVAAYGVTLFFLYASWRLILPQSLTVLSCGLFVVFIPCYEKNWLGQYWTLFPWASVFALMFQSIGQYALFQIIRGEPSKRWGLILGSACACVFWCRQPVGLIMFGCLAVIWLALHWTNWPAAHYSKRSILVGILAGFAIVNALLLGQILFSGALPAWWYQNYVWPGKWMLGGVSDNLHEFILVFVHPAAGAWLLVLLLAAAIPGLAGKFRMSFSTRGRTAYYVCLGGLLAWQHERVFAVLALRDGGWTALFPVIILLQAVISITLAFVRRGTPKTTEYYLVAALAALSLGSLLQYYPVPDIWHIFWSLAPAFGLLVFAFWRWVGWPAPAVAMLVSMAFLPSCYARVQTAIQDLALPRVTLVEPAVLRGMKVSPELARNLGQIMDTLRPILRHQPDIPSALIGDDAMYLCLTNNHLNPTPYYVTWQGLAENVENQKRWDYILRVRPLMILLNARWAAVDDFYRRSHYVPLLYIPERKLEIAVPQELAASLGLTAYAGGGRRDGPAAAKP